MKIRHLRKLFILLLLMFFSMSLFACEFGSDKEIPEEDKDIYSLQNDDVEDKTINILSAYFLLVPSIKDWNSLPSSELIYNKEDLKKYTSCTNKGWNSNGEEIHNQELTKIFNNYNDLYFSSQQLVAVCFSAGSGGNRYELAKVEYENGKLNVYVKLINYGVSSDMSYWFALIETDDLYPVDTKVKLIGSQHNPDYEEPVKEPIVEIPNKVLDKPVSHFLSTTYVANSNELPHTELIYNKEELEKYIWYTKIGWNENGETVYNIDSLEILNSYDDEYFNTGQLAAVRFSASSGSNHYKLAKIEYLDGELIVYVHQLPVNSMYVTGDMRYWLLLIELDDLYPVNTKVVLSNTKSETEYEDAPIQEPADEYLSLNDVFNGLGWNYNINEIEQLVLGHFVLSSIRTHSNKDNYINWIYSLIDLNYVEVSCEKVVKITDQVIITDTVNDQFIAWYWFVYYLTNGTKISFYIFEDGKVIFSDGQKSFVSVELIDEAELTFEKILTYEVKEPEIDNPNIIIDNNGKKYEVLNVVKFPSDNIILISSVYQLARYLGTSFEEFVGSRVMTDTIKEDWIIWVTYCKKILDIYNEEFFKTKQLVIVGFIGKGSSSHQFVIDEITYNNGVLNIYYKDNATILTCDIVNIWFNKMVVMDKNPDLTKISFIFKGTSRYSYEYYVDKSLVDINAYRYDEIEGLDKSKYGIGPGFYFGDGFTYLITNWDDFAKLRKELEENPPNGIYYPAYGGGNLYQTYREKLDYMFGELYKYYPKVFFEKYQLILVSYVTGYAQLTYDVENMMFENGVLNINYYAYYPFGQLECLLCVCGNYAGGLIIPKIPSLEKIVFNYSTLDDIIVEKNCKDTYTLNEVLEIMVPGFDVSNIAEIVAYKTYLSYPSCILKVSLKITNLIENMSMEYYIADVSPRFNIDDLIVSIFAKDDCISPVLSLWILEDGTVYFQKESIYYISTEKIDVSLLDFSTNTNIYLPH